jgi:alpha-glucosidase
MRSFSPSTFCEQVFVNMLAGPLDMCNGLYTLKNPAADRPKVFENVNTTIVAETARTMITFSGLSILPDCPEAYKARADLFDYLSRLPMTWDETRILHGEIGQYITTARRSERKWFVASATDQQARTLEIKFNFLEEGQLYQATLYEDAPGAHYIDNREAYQVNKTTIRKDDTIQAVLAPGGGHCIYLEPVTSTNDQD